MKRKDSIRNIVIPCVLCYDAAGGDCVARYYSSPGAQCPFYRMEEPNTIHCEGVIPDSTIQLYIKKAPAKYRLRYCCGDWKCCPIAKMLWGLHDDPKNLRMMTLTRPYQVRGEQI